MLNKVLDYPLRLTGIICLLLYFTAGIFFNSDMLTGEEISFLLIGSIFALCGADFNQRLIILLAGALLFLIYLLCFPALPLFLTGAELSLLATLVYFRRKEKAVFPFAIIAAAFLCHLYYIQTTALEVRQHDLNGILFYMQEITDKGLNWRDFNPWNMYYLFHQPLHFFISGHIYRLSLTLWGSPVLAGELLQYVSLFYVTASSILAAMILKELKLPYFLFLTGGTLFAFHPTLFLFSGYISDDAPVVFWGLAVTYFVLRWYKTNFTAYLLYAALCFGAGVLTKLSMLMMVPALSVLFAYKLIKNKEKRADIYQGLCLFIIIAVPLSLLWVIRNHILYDMPFYNVPDTSPWGQNFKHLSFAERISDFSQLFSPFLSVPASVDANIWLAILKTELFGEWNPFIHRSLAYYPAFFIYLFNLIIKPLVLGGLIVLLPKIKRLPSLIFPFIVFWLIQYVTVWSYGFKYAMDYPYACSTDYRLFAQLLLPEIIFICMILRIIANKRQQIGIFAVALAYATIISCVYFSML